MAFSRLRTPFKPPQVTLKQIHDAVPKHLARKNPYLSSYYMIRDLALCISLFCFGFSIPTLVSTILQHFPNLPQGSEPVLTTLLWINYWWWQGLVFTSFFCIGE